MEKRVSELVQLNGGGTKCKPLPTNVYIDYQGGCNGSKRFVGPTPAEFFVLVSGEYTGMLGPLLLACEKYKLDPVQSKPSLLTTRRFSIPGEVRQLRLLSLITKLKSALQLGQASSFGT